MEAVGNFSGAATEFLLAGNYEDAPDKNREMVYLQAEDAMKKGKLEDAQALYASIPGYEDADDKSHACLYTLANIAMADMEYTLAYGLLKQVPEGYLDADSLRAQAAYEAGKTARDNGDLETARELLEAAGKYKNAQRILNQVNAEIQKAEAATQAEAVPGETDALPAVTEIPAAETPAEPGNARNAGTGTSEPAQDDEYAVKDGE